MKIKNSLNEKEIELLKKINIEIEDRDYDFDEIEDIKEDIVFKGEICNFDKNENPTELSDKYSELADKFIEFGEET